MRSVQNSAHSARRPLSTLEWGWLTSLALHAGAAALLVWRPAFLEDLLLPDAYRDPLEIDLTRPFRITSNPLLARKAEHSGAGAAVVEKPDFSSPPPAPDPVKAPLKEWILPGPETEILEKPPEETPAASAQGVPGGTGTGLGGLGDGSGDGEVDWIYLTALPQLLDKEALLRDIQRFYPAQERQANREAWVNVDAHIDAEGRVRGVDIVQSAGPAFDQAARQVLARARFSPARVGAKAVPVKVRWPLGFQLE